MSEKKITEEAIKDVIANEQLSDILLIIDKKNNKVDALKEIDKNGKIKTTPAEKEKQNEFLKIGHNSDALDIAITAIKNFYSQSRDPTQFEILKVPFKIFSGIRDTFKLINELAKSDRSTQANAFADQYRVDNIETAKQPINTSNNNNQNSEIMAKNEQRAPMAQTAPAGQPDQNQDRKRFNESMIDWKSIENLGVSRDYLKDKGLLDPMLKGYKTSQLVPVSLNLGAAVIRTDARLSFQQSKAGSVVLAVHGLRQEPQLHRPFFGHIFSEEDKSNMRETGNMGRSVELKDRNNEYHPYLISIDKLTNELVAARADKITIPNEIKGVELTNVDKDDLREGKKIHLDGMISKTGKEFSADIQLSADTRSIQYIFPQDNNRNAQLIGGVELSPQQAKDLTEGKAIFVEDMKRKDGELFSSYIKRDEATNNLAYTRYNPDSPEGAREIYIPKQVGGVELTGEEREMLRRGTPIFLDKMINRKGEEFDSYIKADTQTGKLSYSNKPDGFAQQEKFVIPPELFGATLTATQRAQMQDGKAVLVEGMKGFDNKLFSSYVKINQNQGKLDYYNEDPDKPKAAQRNANKPEAEQKQTATQEKKGPDTGQKQTQAKEEKEQKETKPRKSRGPKI